MDQAYWDAYYASKGHGSVIPSQFAAFVASEYLNGHQVVDFGCGNGRDALFFAGLGNPVLGVDGSASAISLCARQAEARGVRRARFVRRDLSDGALAGELTSLLAGAGTRLVYARFFLHAITEAEEDAFLRTAAALMTSPEDVLALEFRTHRDRDLPKETASHFRRYVDPLEVAKRAAALDLGAEYFVEGFGFAKYRNDDAHVARFIFRRSA